MGGSIDAQLNLIGDISKMLGGKTLEQALKDDRKREEDNFRLTAGWSFDPTQYGFRVLKRFSGGYFGRKKDVTFEWYAEKSIKFRTKVWVFHIRKKDDGEYVIRRTITDYAKEFDQPPKVWDCIIPDDAGAKQVLGELKAWRGK